MLLWREIWLFPMFHNNIPITDSQLYVGPYQFTMNFKASGFKTSSPYNSEVQTLQFKRVSPVLPPSWAGLLINITSRCLHPSHCCSSSFPPAPLARSLTQLLLTDFHKTSWLSRMWACRQEYRPDRAPLYPHLILYLPSNRHHNLARGEPMHYMGSKLICCWEVFYQVVLYKHHVGEKSVWNVV